MSLIRKTLEKRRQRTEDWRVRALEMGSGSRASKGSRKIRRGSVVEAGKEKGFQKEVQYGFSSFRGQREVK